MNIAFLTPPETEGEYLVLLALYKTNKDVIWPIIHRWVKLYGAPKNQCEQPIKMEYYYRFLMYIKEH